MIIKTEIWKPVRGYEELYEVSSEGRVRALGRETFYYMKGTPTLRRVKPHIKKLTPNGRGYLTATVHKEGVSKRIAVHRLVAQAFIPNPGAKDEVNHLDRNKLNNAVTNLEWVTRQQNIAHAVETGFHLNGPTMKELILKEVHDNPDIRTRDIAGKLGVTSTYVSKVRHNRK